MMAKLKIETHSLVLASRNLKKVAEIASWLQPWGIEVIDVGQIKDAPEVDETGTTFAENAALKASQVAQAIDRWVVADDSGLEVDALAGAPGVYSARYAGPGCSDEDNNRKLLEALAGVPTERRGAQYACHLAIADPSGAIRITSEGSCRGRILTELQGDHGFGYDPLFLIPEYHRTFGELSPRVKSLISHRARALERLTRTSLGS